MTTIPHTIARMIFFGKLHPVVAWRQYYGLSQAMLAEYLHLKLDELAKIETSNQHLQPEYLNMLSQFFGVYPDALGIRYNNFNQ